LICQAFYKHSMCSLVFYKVGDFQAFEKKISGNFKAFEKVF